MTPPRVIAFVDHEIGRRLLQRLLDLHKRGEVALVAAVTTLENGSRWWPGVDDLCREAELPLYRYEAPFTATLAHADIDWYFLLSWKHLLPARLIAHPSRGAVNLHYSLLPRHRGVYPVNWAIVEGCESTGVTFHLVDDTIDGGPALCRRRVSIHGWDTARTLQLRLDDAAFALFDELWQGLGRGDAITRPAPAQGEGSYRSRKDFEALRELPLDRTATVGEILNLLRGMTFAPGGANLFFIDPKTGKKVFVGLSLHAED